MSDVISDGGPELATLLTRTTADTWKLYVAPRSRDVTRAEFTLAPTERVLSMCVCVCVGGGGGVTTVLYYGKITTKNNMVIQDNKWPGLPTSSD